MIARRQWFGLISLVFLLSLFVVSCGGDPTPTPAPTALPPPPTQAPTLPPPPTAVPPTQAPASTGTQGGTLVDALGKAKAATNYRVALTISGKGNFAVQGDVTPVTGAEPEPITLVSMQGEVDGNNAHFMLQGLFTSFLGIEPPNSMEVISIDGTPYIKGPIPLFGATEEKWYQAPAEAASVAQPPLTPNTFLESFGEAGIDPAAFTLEGTESLDGQNCEVYSGDKDAVVDAFSKLGGAAGTTPQDLGSIDAAEFKFWVCPDGYLHQIRMAIEGHEQDKPDEKGSVEILMKISDFDADINITAPPDAEPLSLPTFGATPTP